MLTPQDRWDISDLLSRYCFAADLRDLAALDAVFTDDVECVFQSGSRIGRDNVRAFMDSVLSRLSATQHNVTSSVVVESGDGATGMTHLLAQHVREGIEGGETLAMGGTYHDEFRRTDDGWRIARRQLVGSWRVGNPEVLNVDTSLSDS